MIKEELISIVVPIYNVEAYLEKCILSIISQTYKKIEIILVNDGSTDKSPEICDYLKTMDNRIVVIHKRNGGLSDARNVGIKKSTGKYIALIDSDDFIHETFIEKLYNVAYMHNADIVQCDFQKFTNINEIQNIEHNENIQLFNNIDALLELYKHKKNINVVAWNKLYKRELFDEILYPFAKIHEDEFTTYKLLYNSKIIAKINLPLYFYRVRTNSITSCFNEKRLDILQAFSEVDNFYTNNKLIHLKIKNLEVAMNTAAEFSILSNNKEIKTRLRAFYINQYKQYISLPTKKNNFYRIKYFLFNYFPFLVPLFYKFRNMIKNR